MSHQGLNNSHFIPNLQARGTPNDNYETSYMYTKYEGEQPNEQRQWFLNTMAACPQQPTITSLLQTNTRANYLHPAAATASLGCQGKFDDSKGRKRKLSGQPLDLTVTNRSDVIDLSSKRQATGNEVNYHFGVRATEPPVPKQMAKPVVSVPDNRRLNSSLEKGIESLFHLVIDNRYTRTHPTGNRLNDADYREDQPSSRQCQIISSKIYSDREHNSLYECAFIQLEHTNLPKVFAIRFKNKWYCWLSLIAAALRVDYEALEKSLTRLGQSELIAPPQIVNRLLHYYLQSEHKPAYVPSRLVTGHLIALESITSEIFTNFLHSCIEKARHQRNTLLLAKSQDLASLGSKVSTAPTRPILPKNNASSTTTSSASSPPPVISKLHQSKEADEGPKPQTLTFRDRTFYYVKRGASKFISKQHLYEKLFKDSDNYHKFSKAVKSAGFVLRNSSKQEEELLKEPEDHLQSHRLLLLSDLEKNFDKLLS